MKNDTKVAGKVQKAPGREQIKVGVNIQNAPKPKQTRSEIKKQNKQAKKLREKVKTLPKAISAETIVHLTDPTSLKRQQEAWEKKPLATVGLDLGDVNSNACMLNRAGIEVGEFLVGTTPDGFEKFFRELPAGSLIVLEVGTHSPWASRLLRQLGFEVRVVNARKIGKRRIKTDRRDARMLARRGYDESEDLVEVRHRGEQQQKDLLVIQTRATLVATRTDLINVARGKVKAFGYRLEAMDTDNVTAALADDLPADIMGPIQALLRMVEAVNLELELLDDEIKRLIHLYPVTRKMMKIGSVGEVTALTFVLTISEVERFSSSRTVGVAMGLTPGKDQSGQSDPQLGISKAGNEYMRGLLVQCAQLTLSKRGKDSDIRRWGLKLAGNGTDGHQKKRAVVAVARKLAVLMHTLWSSGAAYDPFHSSKREAKKQQAKAAKAA